MVMLIVRRSASNERMSCIISYVGPSISVLMKWSKSSRYALYNEFRMISIFKSSRSAAETHSRKYGAAEKMSDNHRNVSRIERKVAQRVDPEIRHSTKQITVRCTAIP